MRIFAFFIQTFVFTSAFSQLSHFNFKRLSSTEGLSDCIVRCFAEDSYGYIWIGTSYGLNRFDGISVKSYYSKAKDSSSIPDNFIQTLYNDKKNHLWIGTLHGLCRYNYESGKFESYKLPQGFLATGFIEDKKGRLWVSSYNGLWLVNEQMRSVEKFSRDTSVLEKFQCSITKIMAYKENWYMATSSGIKIFNPYNGHYQEIRHSNDKQNSLSSDFVHSLAIDSSGNLWADCILLNRSILNKIDLKNGTVRKYRRFIDAHPKWVYNTLNGIMTDRSGRVWIISSASGLSLYDSQKDDFEDYQNDPLLSTSLVANHSISLYEDDQGIIWIGSAGYGCSYFNPDKKLFSTIYSPANTGIAITETWCRAACEDRNGNLWLGSGSGLIRYNPSNQNFSVFSNSNQKKQVLCYNSIRSLLEDDEGDIWIGTAKGLNRYHPGNGHMDFFNGKEVPPAFFWMMAKDKHGQVWLGSASGLFKYIREKNKFDNLTTDSVLHRYAFKNVQALYVDSRNRLWIGLMDVGLVLYDLERKTERLLTIKDSLLSDTRFSSFAEDKNGIMWIGSEQGLVAYDPQKNCSVFYTREMGLPSERTNNLMVDSLNRVWIGTSNGLCVLSADRKRIKRFDASDGLFTNQFNEQSACRTHDGLFIFPTYKGFVVVRPDDYRESTTGVPVYIASFKSYNKEITTNTESLEKIHLRPDQNFFSITLAALNYLNPSQCLYAYKLEPFDHDWVVTAKRELNYTNVPAGNYVFRYKVITDNYETPEKELQLSVAEIFYKTWWFKSSLLFLAAAIVVAFYRYRFHQREKIVVLQNKAQLLEKEKTIVQYENLKQQLNPHFLFNSLTSLRSLIRVEPNSATHFLDGLSKTYRYLLRSGNTETVTLEQELSFVETFTDLQKTRFRDGLTLAINVDKFNFNKLIVPATLQNLIENAIKHNTASEESPLVICIYTEGAYVVVKNNLQRYRIVETSNKRGLASLSSLYKYLTDKPILINENEHYFIVKIPLI